MHNGITSSVVNEVIDDGGKVDRPARRAQLEAQLAKLQKDIAEQERLENRWTLIYSAFDKLKREIGKTLTTEEREAVDGMYIFFHSGHVDMVRNTNSATDQGENMRFEKDMSTAEAIHELESLKD